MWMNVFCSFCVWAYSPRVRILSTTHSKTNDSAPLILLAIFSTTKIHVCVCVCVMRYVLCVMHYVVCVCVMCMRMHYGMRMHYVSVYGLYGHAFVWVFALPLEQSGCRLSRGIHLREIIQIVEMLGLCPFWGRIRVNTVYNTLVIDDQLLGASCQTSVQELPKLTRNLYFYWIRLHIQVDASHYDDDSFKSTLIGCFVFTHICVVTFVESSGVNGINGAITKAISIGMWRNEQNICSQSYQYANPS